jgi:hypothetical protein
VAAHVSQAVCKRKPEVGDDLLLGHALAKEPIELRLRQLGDEARQATRAEVTTPDDGPAFRHELVDAHSVRTSLTNCTAFRMGDKPARRCPACEDAEPLAYVQVGIVALRRSPQLVYRREAAPLGGVAGSPGRAGRGFRCLLSSLVEGAAVDDGKLGVGAEHDPRRRWGHAAFGATDRAGHGRAKRCPGPWRRPAQWPEGKSSGFLAYPVHHLDAARTQLVLAGGGLDPLHEQRHRAGGPSARRPSRAGSLWVQRGC